MSGRHAAWEIAKGFALAFYYFLRGDWKYDPVGHKYWPSGRRRWRG